MKKCYFITVEKLKYSILLGIVASFSHFAYELSGRNFVVGLFNPINESVWEHLKFMFFPLLLFWIIIYGIKNKACKTPLSTWITSSAISLVVAPLSVILLFYAYTRSFGSHSLIIDILLVYICYYIAFSTASHFLRFSKPNNFVAIISIIAIVVLFIMFVVFTIYLQNYQYSMTTAKVIFRLNTLLTYEL